MGTKRPDDIPERLGLVTPNDVNAWLRVEGQPEWTPPADSVAPLTATEPVVEAPVSETVEQRRARWLDLFESEQKRCKRGALQRVADSEGVDRANMSKDIQKARAIRTKQSRAGMFVSQMVRDGKRKG